MKVKPKRKVTMANALTKAQEAKKLLEKAHGLIEEAKQEQMDIITAAIGELKELGFTYSIAESGKAPSSPKKPSTASKTAPGEVFCAICDLKGHHDARAHRGQPKDAKRKFTPEELAAVKPKAGAAAA
jgi:hypothetical protein